MANRYGDEEEPGRWPQGRREERRGGGYGIGGPERGYNMGGYGGMGSYEQGYTPRSYDRLLDQTERSRENFGDEWMDTDRATEWRARSPGQGKAPKGYTRSDMRIRDDVCERLMYSPYDASDVEINVTNGEVTLTGTVRTRADKWGIEDVAEAVLGVHDVHNQIRLIRGDAQASEPSTDDTGHVPS
jgi:osmotically-inducible protein OsmY